MKNMTTVTFKKNLNLNKTSYDSVEDFLWAIDYSLIYEEYLERKLLEAKNSWEDEFINL